MKRAPLPSCRVPVGGGMLAPLAALLALAVGPGSLLTQEVGAEAAESATAEPRPMTIVDLINVPGIGSPEISPDGSQLLYTRTDADWDENGTITHIWRVNLDGSGSVRMTNGDKGESSPRWSPDGRTIAFVARRGDDESAQIYLLPNDGGEGRVLTEHPTGVSSIAWSPDGAWIYFTARDDKTEEEKAREEVKDNVFRYDENQKNSHLWRVDVQSEETERITEGDFSLRGYRLSRDGSLIVAHQAPTPLYDDFLHSELWLMRADGTEARRLTVNAVPESGAEISPDNQHVLFTANTGDDLDGFYFNDRLFVLPISGGAAESLVPGGDYDINGATWSADGSAVYFRANTGLRQNLYAVGLVSREIAALTTGDHAIRSWDYEPGVDLHAFSISSPTLGSDLWLLAAAEAPGSTGGSSGAIRGASTSSVSEPQRVTRVHDYVAEEFLLPRVEAVTWPGEDGVMVEGLLYYPLDFRPGTRYPLVVQTHGGPASSDKFSFFSSSRYEPVLTAMGYFVFKPNYRGSTGYGDEFLRDMVGHYFNQAHKDVMAGVDYLIEGGLVDGDRMAKMGWSAGGHMTNKIITYTDRFKAASSGAGAINWISMYGQSDVRIYRTPWFGGTPWDEDSPIEQYMADSPLFDVHRVTTPTIVLVGENDARVPMPQSVELYRALKHNGVPTHLYVAPNQGHGWRELQQRLFKANVELDWFEKWVMEREYEWERSPVHPEEGEEPEKEVKKAA